ncbi:DUF5389 family protein [Chelonobacter oris]|uniref:DUF5389 family protein n=1 Tax=Chelonobacter oris TaxID=505317 RepID=UPI00244AC180|nr:DUF5389 family protein [Chelonobacter oris]
MHKPQQPTGFSGFSWALALFCLPAILWPLALLISPSVADNPNLDSHAVYWFSTALWLYPAVLLGLALLLAKLRKHSPRTALGLLSAGFILFYVFAAYLIRSVWL